jgi:hypothetical protein
MRQLERVGERSVGEVCHVQVVLSRRTRIDFVMDDDTRVEGLVRIDNVWAECQHVDKGIRLTQA